MEKHIFSIAANKVIAVVKEEPVCGEAFCDNCGDCLYCYSEDECFAGPYHKWVEYVD